MERLWLGSADLGVLQEGMGSDAALCKHQPRAGRAPQKRLFLRSQAQRDGSTQLHTAAHPRNALQAPTLHVRRQHCKSAASPAEGPSASTLRDVLLQQQSQSLAQTTAARWHHTRVGVTWAQTPSFQSTNYLLLGKSTQRSTQMLGREARGKEPCERQDQSEQLSFCPQSAGSGAGAG